MVNPFFRNNGPFKFSEILKDLNLKLDEKNKDLCIIDIKDLQNSKINEITFFHSKKYKLAANNTKASFCITSQNLIEELPDRKSVVQGKSVDLGGCRIIKKKKK